MELIGVDGDMKYESGDVEVVAELLGHGWVEMP